LLEDTLYKDSAVPFESSEIAVIPRKDFEQMINNNREIAQRFIRLLAKNIAEKENQLVSLAYNSLRKKVADALVALYTKYYTNEDKPGSIVISRGSLASIAGTAKESMIRTLSDFKTEKLIDIKEDGSIQILDLRRLELMLN
jgi:CRP/FNR family transcriptional regulator, cyclic AMP receptor protein